MDDVGLACRWLHFRGGTASHSRWAQLSHVLRAALHAQVENINRKTKMLRSLASSAKPNFSGPPCSELCVRRQHERCSDAGYFATNDKELAERSQDASLHTEPLTPTVLTNDFLVISTVHNLTRRRSERNVSVAAQVLRPSSCSSGCVDRHLASRAGGVQRCEPHEILLFQSAGFVPLWPQISPRVLPRTLLPICHFLSVAMLVAITALAALALLHAMFTESFVHHAACLAVARNFSTRKQRASPSLMAERPATWMSSASIDCLP